MRRKMQLLFSVMLSMVIVFTLAINVKAADPRGDVGPYFNPYNWLEAEVNFSHPEQAAKEDDGRKVIKLETIKTDNYEYIDYFVMRDVKMSKGLGSIDIKAKADEPAIITIRQNGLDGRFIGRIMVNATDGIYATFTAPTEDAGGKCSYYFICEQGSCYIDKWRANPRDYSVKDDEEDEPKVTDVPDEPNVPDEPETVQSGNPPEVPFAIPYNDVQAETAFDKSANVQLTDTPNGGKAISNITEGEYLGFKDLYFDKGITGVQLLAIAEDKGSIEIRKDAPDGELVGTIDVGRQKNQKGEVIYFPFEETTDTIEGLHTVYFVGKSGNVSIDVWHAWPLRMDGYLHQPGEDISPYFRVEAELDFPRYNTELTTAGFGKDVVAIKGQGGYFSVENVDFKSGLSEIWAFVFCNEDDAQLEIRDGAVDGELLGSVNLKNTNGDAEDYIIKLPKSNEFSGKHNLYFVSSKGSFAVDSWFAYPADSEEIEQQETPEVPEQPEQPETPEVIEQPETPEVSEQPETPEVPEDSKKPFGIEVAEGVYAYYTSTRWDGGYQINMTLTNYSGKRIDDWKVKIKKSDIVLDSIWCADVAEEGDSYVFTAPDWGKSIDDGQIAEFGFTAKGELKGIIIQ